MRKDCLKFRIAVFVVICVIVLFAVAATVSINIHQKSMKLNFRKVPALTRKVGLVTLWGDELTLADITSDGVTTYRKSLPESRFSKGSFSPPAIAPEPNGKVFWVMSGSCLREYSSSMQLLSALSIRDFGLSTEHFGEQAFASERFLWFTAGDSIVQWEPFTPPGNRIFGPKVFTWTVDPNSSRVFIRGKKDGIFDFRSMTFQHKAWGKLGLYLDFVDGQALILSTVLGNDTHEPIVLMDVKANHRKTLPWGAQAQHGAYGHIYFVRGTTQLWRCNHHTGKVEPVYLATWLPRYANQGFMHVLRFSHDRTVLGFYFWRPASEEHELKGIAPDPRQHGIVLIDLQNKEYMEILGEHLWPLENMAIFESEDTSSDV